MERTFLDTFCVAALMTCVHVYAVSGAQLVSAAPYVLQEAR